ncbi:MAG: leucine-rich repeat protein [Oscillospiraceae bacterium]|jgi:hypothetical protein|nr:leucine-rich repeat protein [Oscillospiraceae bacterium]
MKKNFTKAISLLLALVLCAGLFTAAASAAYTRTPVTAITLNRTAPVYGNYGAFAVRADGTNVNDATDVLIHKWTGSALGDVITPLEVTREDVDAAGGNWTAARTEKVAGNPAGYVKEGLFSSNSDNTGGMTITLGEQFPRGEYRVVLYNGEARTDITASLIVGGSVLVTENTAIGWYGAADTIAADTFNTIAIPDNVTTIAEAAFLNCIGLTSVTIPDSVTVIEGGAFVYCLELQKVTLSDNLKSIGRYAFSQCYKLKDITIPAGVTEIGEGALNGGGTDLTVHGAAGSYAEAYAKENNIPFTAITPPALTAKPTASTVLVNGSNKAFDAYHIDGNNFFKLRDLAYVLSGTAKQFEVGYDEKTKAITLTSDKAYTPEGDEMTGKGDGVKTPKPTQSKIYLDGKEISLTVYIIGGNNYFKLRDVGEAFDFGVDYDAVKKTIVIDTGKGYTPE